MIERRYTGIAKQGADVVANPTLDGSEANLESIGINGTNYKVGGLKFVCRCPIDIENSKDYEIKFICDKLLTPGKLYLAERYDENMNNIYGALFTTRYFNINPSEEECRTKFMPEIKASNSDDDSIIKGALSYRYPLNEENELYKRRLTIRTDEPQYFSENDYIDIYEV